MKEEKKMLVGLPRALLFYRYGNLWQFFFHNLGCETLVSEPTSRVVVDEGSELAPDEACLSLKIFLGHVKSLIGRCDCIFVPRMANLGRNQQMCVRFGALYDLTCSVFRDSGQKFLTCNIDVTGGHSPGDAFRLLGQALGHTAKESGKAWKAAKKSYDEAWKIRTEVEERRYRQDGLKVLVVGHAYIIEDPYVGGVILQCLHEQGVMALRADVTDRESALKHSEELSPTCRWLMSRELLGSVAQKKDRVDGIVLVSAFSCGPDSMVNEILSRQCGGLPVLRLVVDSQSGTAGMETRIESFVDIIRMKAGMDV